VDPPGGQNHAADRPDAGPFAALLASCQRPVFLYATSLLRNTAAAEEALQQTRVVLWQKFDRYQPGTDFVRFACGVARNEALKIRAKRPARSNSSTMVFSRYWQPVRRSRRRPDTRP
jgi:RNA polymerase sigma-70 factor (ECF subfamily)